MKTRSSIISSLALAALVLGWAGCAQVVSRTADDNSNSDGNSDGNSNSNSEVECQNGTDDDGDGYGPGCALGADCNDFDGAVHPGADEVCNNIDDDCDGVIDEDLACLFEVCTEPGGTPEDEDRDGSIDEGCPCEYGASRECCGTGVQVCEGGTSELGGQWGTCSESCIQCDELPPNLGGYRIVFDPGSSTWAIQTDANGNPIQENGQSDTTRTCTLRTERVESGQDSSVSVPASAREVFYQIVGGGGGGGRHFEPPSTGGGAGGYATGTIDISAAMAPVLLSASAGVGGSVVAPTCSEDVCNFTCTCPRGAGEPGTDSMLDVGGVVITADGGAAGTWGVTAPGGVYGVQGSSNSATVHLNTDLSTAGNTGQVGAQSGYSGTGGSPACNWGTGAEGNQSGTGYGAGGGGGNNSPAGAGSGGLIILLWTDCS